MLAICTYSLAKCGALEIMDVVSNHAFALIRRAGKWQIVERLSASQNHLHFWILGWYSAPGSKNNWAGLQPSPSHSNPTHFSRSCPECCQTKVQ